MRKSTARPNQVTLEFDSWDEFVGYVETTPSQCPEGQSPSRTGGMQLTPEHHRIVKYWGGEDSLETALTKARQGWQEGAEEIFKVFNEFRLPAKRVAQEIGFNVVGPGTLDMGRYIMGHPQAWMVWQDTEVTNDQLVANGGIVRLGINISQQGSVSATQRFEAGAAMLSLIDLLERSNRRVELTLYNAVTGANGGYIRIQVLVKHADSPVNLSILAFAFANAATQRRLCWAVRETMDETTRKACSIKSEKQGGNMGQTDAEWVGSNLHGQTVLQGLGDSPLYTQEHRTRWLQTQLQAQGIEWDGK